MAHSKNFFGMRRGSTKSHTYQVFRGMQVTKDRVYDVANPQTDAQMKQRLKLPIVANARAILKTLVDHSFEGEIYGEPSLKKFSQLNLAKEALHIYSYVPKGAMDSGIAELIISKGTLRELRINANGDQTSMNIDFSGNGTNTPEVDWPSGGKPTEDGDTISPAQLKAIAKAWGIEEGQQVTILIQHTGKLYSYIAADNTEADTYFHRFLIARLMFNFTEGDERWKIKDETTTDDDTSEKTPGWSIDDGFIKIRTSGSNSDATISISDSLDGTQNGEGMITSAAAILSQKIDNVWRRSPAHLTYNTAFPQQDCVSFDDAKASYLRAAADSNRYLNSGLEGVDIPGGNG